MLGWDLYVENFTSSSSLHLFQPSKRKKKWTWMVRWWATVCFRKNLLKELEYFEKQMLDHGLPQVLGLHPEEHGTDYEHAQWSIFYHCIESKCYGRFLLTLLLLLAFIQVNPPKTLVGNHMFWAISTLWNCTLFHLVQHYEPGIGVGWLGGFL